MIFRNVILFLYKLTMRWALIIYIWFINIIQAIIIANNAQVWPPSLLAFSPSFNKTTCCSEKIVEYNMLGVGQNKTVGDNNNDNNNNNIDNNNNISLCLSNSAIGLIWSPPEIFNVSKHSSIILEAKIIDGELDLWYNVTLL